MSGAMIPFPLDAELVFRARPVRVAGRLTLEGASGQVSYRYHLTDGVGAPILVEQASERFALLRPLPSAADPQTPGNAILIGNERYTLVGVRKLTMLDAVGLISGATPKAPLLLSGMFEGPAGTLMRELVPGSSKQVYYLVKPLARGELLSAEAHAAAREAARHAAGERDDD